MAAVAGTTVPTRSPLCVLPHLDTIADTRLDNPKASSDAPIVLLHCSANGVIFVAHALAQKFADSTSCAVLALQAKATAITSV